MTPGLARAFGRPDATGALVAEVAAGGAAERAGLHTGDIVYATGDHRAPTFAELQQAVAATPPGTLLPISVWRAGRARRMTIEIAALESGSRPGLDADALPRGDRLGLIVVESPARGDSMAAGGLGLEVRESHGAALRAGIGAGDVILAVNDQPADRLDLYRAALARIGPGTYIALLVMRSGSVQYFAIAP
ncbi:MAG: PDZ domain-containing protein [Caldimonas sp.]